MNSIPSSQRPTVAVVYNFLPHYRSGVFLKLLESTRYQYLFVAGHNNLVPSIPEWQIPDGAPFVEAPCRWISRPWFFQHGLAALALRSDVDAIIYLANPYSLSTWYSALLGRLSGKQILFWTHGWLANKGLVREAVKKSFLRLANVLLLYGHRAKSIGAGMGFTSKRMVVVYNSLNYSEQLAIRGSISDDDLRLLRVRMFGDSTTPYVVCTARLTEECGLELLLQAQAMLRKDNKLVNVVLVGDGPACARLAELARAESLPVVFIGECYDEATLAPLIRAASVTVSPGKVGLTAIHSLTYGTPVITHNDFSRQGPEVEAITPAGNGDLFERGNAADLAQVIWKWCNRKWPDAEVREQCYEIVDRHYNPASQVEAIEDALTAGSAHGGRV